MSETKIFTTLMLLTAIAFVSTITSVKAGVLDNFAVKKGNIGKSYSLEQVVAGLKGTKTCLYKSGHPKFMSKDMNKQICRDAKGLGVVNEIHWKEISSDAKRKILGL